MNWTGEPGGRWGRRGKEAQALRAGSGRCSGAPSSRRRRGAALSGAVMLPCLSSARPQASPTGGERGGERLAAPAPPPTPACPPGRPHSGRCLDPSGRPRHSCPTPCAALPGGAPRAHRTLPRRILRPRQHAAVLGDVGRCFCFKVSLTALSEASVVTLISRQHDTGAHASPCTHPGARCAWGSCPSCMLLGRGSCSIISY